MGDIMLGTTMEKEEVMQVKAEGKENHRINDDFERGLGGGAGGKRSLLPPSLPVNVVEPTP